MRFATIFGCEVQIAEAGVAHFCMRFRQQLYLDVAWTRSASSGFVASRSVHLTTMAMASVLSPVITLALALTAKWNRGGRFGL